MKTAKEMLDDTLSVLDGPDSLVAAMIRDMEARARLGYRFYEIYKGTTSVHRYNALVLEGVAKKLEGLGYKFRGKVNNPNWLITW